MPEAVINIAEAARIYQRITGDERSPKVIEADVRMFRHLGCFNQASHSVDPKLVGVNRHRWEYFGNTSSV